MNQHTCFSTAGTCCDNNTTRILVGNNLHLAFRQLTEQLSIFLRRQITLYFIYPVPFEIFRDKFLIVHLEIVPHILQSCIIILHHQIGILTHDMNLLNLLLVEFIQHSVVIQLISRFIVLYSLDIHGVIKNQKTAFKFERTDF